ncbi:MAG: hypothetical protein KKH32_13120, partial [Bacteroidetes bacterium]|nr:hypothetical protein [Bacteroidota bacterium]
YLQVLEFPTRFTAYAVHPKDPLEKMGSEVSREPIRNENSVDCVTSVNNETGLGVLQSGKQEWQKSGGV